MNTSLGILGTGAVGVTLANGYRELGYSVTIGSRTPKSVDGWTGTVASFEDVAAASDIVILAVKGSAALDVVERITPLIAGKLVVDTTNPIAETAPQDGVVDFFTSHHLSLFEQLQACAPDARFVKAFSCVGNAMMIHPQLEGGPPTMFICGNDHAAKQTVHGMLDAVGWHVADMGTERAARAIEPLCMLWCISGFLDNDWTHAYRLLTTS